MKRFGNWACLIGLCLAGSAALAPAWAQTDEERAAARVAAQQGVAAFNEGRFAQAVDLFERAESVVHAPTHLLYTARAYEKIGKLVRARELYLKLTQEQLVPTAPKPFREAKADGARELAALEPRLASVTLVVQGTQTPHGAAQNVRVTGDGIQVPSALIGIARPTDPGSHTFQAFADGMQSAETTVTVREGARESVTLMLQRLPDARIGQTAPTASPTAPPPTGIPGPVPPPTGGGASEPPPSHTLRNAGFVSLGIGVAGLVVGGIFLPTYLNKQKEGNDAYLACKAANTCATDDTDEARRIANMDSSRDQAMYVSIAGFAVGGVGVAAGITMILLDGHKSSSSSTPSHAPRITPWFGLNSAGVSGTF